MQLYDFIYVDLEKVISIYSQMTGGIVEVLERSTENSRSADNKRNYDSDGAETGAFQRDRGPDWSIGAQR